ncbi:MAG: HepT-like ribonuclease domain-containing protein [Pseudolabrys sp.]
MFGNLLGATRFMRSNSDFGPLSDIAQNIAPARKFVSRLSFAEFQNDTKTVYAVTRSLEIISKASRRLSDELKNRYPQIAWSQMAGAGNIYRHGYQDIRADVLWRTAHEFLGPLLTIAEEEAERLKSGR